LVRWEIEKSFDGQLCQKYLYQKLLKLLNPFSSYNQLEIRGRAQREGRPGAYARMSPACVRPNMPSMPECVCLWSVAGRGRALLDSDTQAHCHCHQHATSHRTPLRLLPTRFTYSFYSLSLFIRRSRSIQRDST